MRELGTIVLTAVFAAQQYPPAFPRTNATKLMETDRIVVWDIVWPKGQPTPMHQHVHDQVGTYRRTQGSWLDRGVDWRRARDALGRRPCRDHAGSQWAVPGVAPGPTAAAGSGSVAVIEGDLAGPRRGIHDIADRQ